MKPTAQKLYIHPDSIQIFRQRDLGPERRAKFAFRTDPEGALTAIVPISDDRLTSAAAVPRAAIYAWCGSSRPSESAAHGLSVMSFAGATRTVFLRAPRRLVTPTLSNCGVAKPRPTQGTPVPADVVTLDNPHLSSPENGRRKLPTETPNSVEGCPAGRAGRDAETYKGMSDHTARAKSLVSCPDSEETGIRFEKERVYGYSGGARRCPPDP